jgi:hypothetical protein
LAAALPVPLVVRMGVARDLARTCESDVVVNPGFDVFDLAQCVGLMAFARDRFPGNRRSMLSFGG